MMKTRSFILTPSAWTKVGDAPCFIECVSAFPVDYVLATEAPSNIDADSLRLERDLTVTSLGLSVYAKAARRQSSEVIVSPVSGADAPGPGPGESHIGQVGGETAIAVATFKRPADVVAYAIGDLVANSVTPGAVVPVELTVSRKDGGAGRIARAHLARSKSESAAFRIHLFDLAPVTHAASGDNLPIVTGGARSYIGAFDITTDRAFSDGAKGFGVPVGAPYIAFETAAGSTKLFGLVEARGVVNPASAETFTITLEVDRD